MFFWGGWGGGGWGLLGCVPWGGGLGGVPGGPAGRPLTTKRCLFSFPPRHNSPRTVVLFLQFRHLPRTPRPRPSVLRVVRFSPQMSRQSWSNANNMSRFEARCASSRLRRSYFFQQVLMRVLYEVICSCQPAQWGGKGVSCSVWALTACLTNRTYR